MLSAHRPASANRSVVALAAPKMLRDSFDRKVGRVLRRLAQQRIRLVLQPGNYWVIDNAITRDDDTNAVLLTCFMRGWIEPLEHAVPAQDLTPEGNLPANLQFERQETFYRLTSAGWSAIHRSHVVALCALAISAMSFTIALAGHWIR